MSTRAGIVTVAGKPNAGKSTLLNRLVGQHLAITSPKPQSTRDRIVGLRTEDGVQMVILDTPGLLEPRHHLHKSMLGAAHAALREADVIVHVVDASREAPAPLVEVARLEAAPSAPVLLALNKCDLVDGTGRARLAASDPFPYNPGEKRGMLVEATLGKGTWTYVGLALFRQVPAGVPGGWRLLANLVSRPRGRASK